MEKWLNRGDIFKKEYDKLNCPKCEYHFGVGNLSQFGSYYQCPSCSVNIVIWETIPTNFYILRDELPDNLSFLIEYLDSLDIDKARYTLRDLMKLFGTSDYADFIKNGGV